MAATYEPIATTTLGSAAASITLSSIPATYTDLRLVIVARGTTADNCSIQFNNDTGTNYSETGLQGNGTAAASWRRTNVAYIRLTNAAGLPTAANTFLMNTYDIFNYAGSTYKTVLGVNSNDQNGSGDSGRLAGLWRSTSAITSIKIFTNFGADFTIGTTATLYGILKA
jgi:hypothetical protein